MRFSSLGTCTGWTSASLEAESPVEPLRMHALLVMEHPDKCLGLTGSFVFNEMY
jgi:hypothetical protein